MTSPSEGSLTCPACGMIVFSLESVCPRCGTEISRQARYECPFCGETISEGLKRCPICQVDLSVISDESKITSIDESLDVLLNDLIEIESSHVKEENKRFCCPKCSWLLEGSEPKCPNCGQVLAGPFGLRCPICAMPVQKDTMECPKCGIALAKIRKGAKPIVPYVQKPKEEYVMELDKVEEPYTCPSCGTVSKKGLQRCPICRLRIYGAESSETEMDRVKAKSVDGALAALSILEKRAKATPRTRKLKPTRAAPVPSVSSPARPGGSANGRSKRVRLRAK